LMGSLSIHLCSFHNLIISAKFEINSYILAILKLMGACDQT